MIKRVYFVKGNPSIESDSEGKDFSKKVEELFFSLNKEKCEDCDCGCEYELKKVDDYEEDLDEDFEERDDTEKAIIIDRSQIEDDVWEFLFFDDETSEFVWAFYGDYDYNEAKEKFLEEFDHLDVKFYLAD
jgi:hypothetical protein